MKDVAPIHLERIKKNMRDAKLSDRSIQYAIAVVRQVFNFAFRHRLWSGTNPAKLVKTPSINNRRTRYLTPDEAKALLDKIKYK
jgi:site-specific recombinase XerD